jgi:NADPH:quinone reductase
LKIMKAWQVNQWCGPDEMAFADLPMPTPGAGQVRIKVAAAALNFLDTLMIQGKYQVKPALPFTPGVEFSGVIDAVGEGVSLKVGTPVAGQTQTGAYAEYLITEAKQVAPLPPGVDLALASTMPIVYPTAHLSLKDSGHLKEGDTVLITAAAGGVGLAAIQLAKAWGAGRIIAVAGGLDKLEICKDHGATDTFDYNNPQWADEVKVAFPNGADIIIDMVGGEVAEKCFKLIAWRGRFVVVGFAGGTIPSMPLNRLLLKSASASGVFWGAVAGKEPKFAQQVFSDLFALLAQGKIKPIVNHRYPLEHAPQAMKDLAARKTTGKVILEP